MFKLPEYIKIKNNLNTILYVLHRDFPKLKWRDGTELLSEFEGREGITELHIDDHHVNWYSHECDSESLSLDEIYYNNISVGDEGIFVGGINRNTWGAAVQIEDKIKVTEKNEDFEIGYKVISFSKTWYAQPFGIYLDKWDKFSSVYCNCSSPNLITTGFNTLSFTICRNCKKERK